MLRSNFSRERSSLAGKEKTGVCPASAVLARPYNRDNPPNLNDPNRMSAALYY